MKNNILAITGLGFLLLTALALAATAAFESIIGLADLFNARKEVVIIMAIFIEWAKLLFAGTLHMFWRTLPWWKWFGVGIVAVHMAVTNIGIYSYLSSGYTLQEAPVAALERQISEVDRQVQGLEIVEQEAVRRVEAMDVAYREYVENLYVRRAEEYKKTNAPLRAQLEAERDEARATIAELEEKRAELVESKEANAAKLGSIEHITTLTGADENVMKVVALFTMLLLLGLDPAAILMVILATHLMGRLLRKEEPTVVLVNEPSDEPELDEKDMEEAKRLKDIGFLDNRTKSKGRR